VAASTWIALESPGALFLHGGKKLNAGLLGVGGEAAAVRAKSGRIELGSGEVSEVLRGGSQANHPGSRRSRSRHDREGERSVLVLKRITSCERGDLLCYDIHIYGV
jgi:hypothetical protein